MKKFLFVLMIAVLIMFTVFCSKESAETTADDLDVDDDIEMIEDELMLDEDADVTDAAPDTAPQVTKADTVENLFALLDEAIKAGDLNKARSLYDATSREKLATADPALAATTVDGSIIFEIENRASHTGRSQVSGSGNTVDVTFPSGQKVDGVVVTKVGGEYRIDVVNSPDGDLLDL